MAGSDSDPSTVKGPAPAHHTPGHHPHRHHGHAGHAAGSFHAHVVAAHRAAPPPLPPAVNEALHTAMTKEGVPESWESGLQFIIGRESSGHVGASNKVDTARGLFQLTKASYHLNPNGANSFGNAVEESQGGIRYVQQRYQTADNAMQFWQRHGWY